MYHNQYNNQLSHLLVIIMITVKIQYDAINYIDEYCNDCKGIAIPRQRRCVNLIASENFAPVPVLEAVGSVMVNKYSEGYPGSWG